MLFEVTKTTRVVALTVLGLLAGAVFARQPSAADLARYQQQLPAVIGATASPELKRYLTSLQQQLTVAKGAERDGVVNSIANAVRVADGIKALQGAYRIPAAPLAYYTVPAMSEVMRLPNIFPDDGKLDADVRILAAKDEYESGSFVLFPFADMSKVELKVSALTGPNGVVLPKENLDLKVVKVWYQNGNRWYSYFSDTGLKLVPELLLNDENLIKADTKAVGNYARVDYPDGSRYRWISPPRKIDSSYDEHGWLTFQTFHPLLEPFADAATLQPVSLTAGEFKQFWLTVNVPKTAVDGLYSGKIELVTAGKTIAAIPIALRILPFELPTPKAFFDPNREFLTTLYSCPSLASLMNGNGGDRQLAEKQLLAIYQDMRKHNLRNPMMEGKPGEQLARTFEIMKEAGLPTRPLIGGSITFTNDAPSPDEIRAITRDADDWVEFLTKNVGHTDIYLGDGDEPGADWVARRRPAWHILHEHGLKVFTAGQDTMFNAGGYIYDMHPAAALPDDPEAPRPWNTVGLAYVGFYAMQHNGSENPAFVRRQHGLLSYLSNYSMIINYEYGFGPWNDLAYDLYKPMTLAYPTHNGVVDTIAWEGFREGLDDIRYATKLKQLAQEAIDSGDIDRVEAGRKVLQWFARLDGTKADLNTARAEMINYIEMLMAGRTTR